MMRHQADGQPQKGRIPTEIEALKRELANVSATWRRRTHGSRLSARRWLGRDAPHVDQRAAWRKLLASVLESTWFHFAVVLLLVVDLVAVIVDVLKTIHIKSEDLEDCVALVETCTCREHFEHREEWKWLFWISFVILAFLLLNVFGLIVAFGRAFFKHPLYVLDLIVVSTALGLEIGLHSDTAGIIIVLTLWRIVRVAHGIFEVTDEAWERDMHKLETQVQTVKHVVEQEQELLAAKDRRIAELEAQLNGSSGDMTHQLDASDVKAHQV